jgi:hypothetical protein
MSRCCLFETEFILPMRECMLSPVRSTYLHSSMAAWRSGHRIRLRNNKARVRIPPGYKVFRETYQYLHNKWFSCCTVSCDTMRPEFVLVLILTVSHGVMRHEILCLVNTPLAKCRHISSGAFTKRKKYLTIWTCKSGYRWPNLLLQVRIFAPYVKEVWQVRQNFKTDRNSF